MSRSGRAICVSLFSAALVCSPASAQSVDELLDIDLSALVEMEVVTPGRRGQTAREAAANVTVVTSEMIHRRGYRTLDEVLRDIPGFDFTIGQPAGEFPAHFLFRGIGDVGQTKVLIMVDGIVRNDVSNGWVRSVGFDFAFADVDRIEVIAGPGSSLYGANAYAGIVNVITSRPSAGRVGLTVSSNLLLSTHRTVAPEAMLAYRFVNGLSLQSQLLDFYQNRGTAEIFGFTLIGDFQLQDRIFGYANYSHTRGEDGELDNISAHKVNLGINVVFADRLNCNLRVNWRGKTKAPTSNVYFYPKSAESIATVGYDYETESIVSTSLTSPIDSGVIAGAKATRQRCCDRHSAVGELRTASTYWAKNHYHIRGIGASRDTSNSA